MFAFRNSVAAGVDVLDLNVTLSADDVLVVQHDLTVDRTTNGTGAVAEMPYAELHALDNAYWFTADCGACTGQPAEAYVHRGVRTGEVAAAGRVHRRRLRHPDVGRRRRRLPRHPAQHRDQGHRASWRCETADALVAELTELDRLDGAVVASFEDDVVAHVSDDRSRRRGLARARRHGGLHRRRHATAGRASGSSSCRRVFEETELLTPDIVDAVHAAGYVDLGVAQRSRARERRRRTPNCSPAASTASTSTTRRRASPPSRRSSPRRRTDDRRSVSAAPTRGRRRSGSVVGRCGSNRSASQATCAI